MEPVTRVGIGCPSTARRSDRHSLGISAGTRTGFRPGMPSSEIPAGMVSSHSQYHSWVVTVRMAPIVNWNVSPARAGNETGTGTAPSRAAPSAIAGTLTERNSPDWLRTSSRVGTEWRPSATTWRSRWSIDRTVGDVTMTDCPTTSTNGVTQAVVGSPSTAAEARSRGAPGNRADALTRTSPRYPRSWSITSSGAALESRASAPTPNERAVGTRISRLIERSGSRLGGTGITRSRLIVKASE